MKRMTASQFSWVKLRLTMIKNGAIGRWRKKYDYCEHIRLSSLQRALKKSPRSVGEAALKWDGSSSANIYDLLRSTPLGIKASSEHLKQFAVLSVGLERHQVAFEFEKNRVLDGLLMSDASAKDGQVAIEVFGKFRPKGFEI